MENPGTQSGESVGLVEDPPPPATATQDQSTSESYSQPQQHQPRPPPPLSPLTGCYLLIVVGEPHSERHKEIILQKIAKAFLSWDINECHVSLEKELQVITGQSPEGEEARFGERLIQYATENLVTEILIHPQLNTLHQCLKNLLSSFTKHRHIIHAGYTFAGNGSWILQDGTLSISDLVEALHEPEVLRVLKAYENSVSIDVHCAPEGDWTTERFQKEPVSKLCNIRINPGDVMTSGNSAISAFIDYLSPFLEPANIQQLLQPTDVVGNIRFTHPTLYVFPGGQGDAALFGINGFNMLIDGGFARKACFWDFARHLDRLDAVLLTRLNNSTVNGISAVLQRKKMNHVYPQIGHFFCNLQDRKIALSPDGDKDKDSLIVNLAEEGQEIVANLRHLALKPHPCYRDGNQVDPVNLYHKVGHGKLDMYVISPARDSQAVKEFLAKWSSNDSHLFSQTGKKTTGKAFEFPLQNLVSICALLVWQPANPNDTITRILFPGSTPQHKIFEGLEKLRHLEFLKHPVCCAKSISPSASTAAINRSVSKTRQPRVIDNKQKEAKVISKPLVKPVKLKTEKTPLKDVKPKLDTNKLADEKNELETLKEPVKKVENVEESLKKLDNRILSKDEQIENIKKEIQKIEQAENEEQRKKIVHRSKYDMRFVKSKVDSRAPSKSIDRKKLPEKKADGDTSPTATPKKGVVNGTATKTEKARVGVKSAKAPSPVSTPAKSAKEANNRKVVEARVSSRSSSKSVTRKKEETPPPPASVAAKPERKPISRRPKASLSPVRSSAGKPSKMEPESLPKKVKKPDIDSTVVKAVSQTISKELEKSSVTEKTEIEEKKDRVIEIKKLEAETENKETDEKAVKNDLESAHIEESNKKEEEDEEEEEEEEYLIVTKEESTEESAKEDEVEEEAQTKDETEGEGEMKKLLREEEESEKKRETIERIDKEDKEIEETARKLAKSEEKDSEDATTGEKGMPKGRKASTSEEQIPEERESELQKLMDVDEGIDLKEPVSKEHKEGESLPEEKISNTLETSATTAPTLPEDERIEELIEEAKEQPEEIKEAVEEKYVQEETKEEKKDEDEKKPEQPNLPSTGDDEGFHVPIPVALKKPRDVVKTPDEVADLPMHEEVDPRMYSSGEFTKDLQKKQDDKPDIKEKVEEIPDMKENMVGFEVGELKKGSTEETEQQEESKNVKDSVTSKYLNIINELEKTATESKEESLEERERLKDVDELKKPEELKTDDRKRSSQEDEVDAELLTPINVEKEITGKTTPEDLLKEDLPRDLVGEISPKTIPVEDDKQKDSINFAKPDEEEQPSGKSTPIDHEKDTSFDLGKQSLLPAESQTGKSSRASTPDPEAKILEASRKSTPDVQEIQEKSIPLKVSREDSGKSTPQEVENQLSRKSSPEDKDLIHVLSRGPTPSDSTKDVSGKSTPIDINKDTSGKSTPQNLEKPLPVQVQEQQILDKTEPHILDKEEIPEESTMRPASVESGKDVSGETILKESGEKIPASLEPEKLSKDISITSIPIESVRNASGKSSPQDFGYEICEEITPQERDLRKPSVAETKTAETQESNLADRAATPQDPNKGVSRELNSQEKVLEHFSETSLPKDLDKKEPLQDVCEKFPTTEDTEKEFEKQSFEDVDQKVYEPPSVEVAKDVSEKLKSLRIEESSVKSTTQEPEEKDSRKSSVSDAPEKSSPLEVSRQPTPQELLKDISGKSTPQDLRKEVMSTLTPLETSGKSTPQDLDKEAIRQSTPQDFVEDISEKSTTQDVKKETSDTTPLDVSGKSSPQVVGGEMSRELTSPKLDKDVSQKIISQDVQKEEVKDLGQDISSEIESGKLNKDISRTSSPEKLFKEISGKSTPEDLAKEEARMTTPHDLPKDVSGKSTPQDLKDSVRTSITPESSGKMTPNKTDKEGSKSPEPQSVSGKSSPAALNKEALQDAGLKDSTKETSRASSPQKETLEKHDLEKPSTPEKFTPDLSKSESRNPSPEDEQKEWPGSYQETSSGKTVPRKTPSENLNGTDTPGVAISDKSGKSSPQDEKDYSRRTSKDMSGKISPESEKEWSGKTSRRESLLGSSPIVASQEDRATPQSLLKDEISSKILATESERDTSGKMSPDIKSGKATPLDTVKDVEERFPKTDTKKVADSISDSVSSGPVEKDPSGKSTPHSTDKEISGKVSPQTGGKVTSDSFSLALAEKGTSGTYSLEKESCEKVSSPSPVDISPLSLDELREDTKEKADREKDVPEAVQGKKQITEIHRTQLERIKYDEGSSGTSTPDRSHVEKSDTSLPNGVESEEECEKGILESERQEKESQIFDISSGEEEELKALEEDEDSEPEIRKGDVAAGLTKEIAKDEKEDINKLVKAETEEEGDSKSGVKRMLVTASSEDGGTETEICIKSGIKIVKEAVDFENGGEGEESEKAEEEKEGEFSNLILQAREEYNAQRSRKTSYNSSEEAEEVEEKAEERKDDVEEELSALLMQARQELAYVRSKGREMHESNGGRVYGTTKTITKSETTRMDDDDLITITTILTEEREEQEDGMIKVTTTKETTTKGGKEEGTVVTVNTNLEKKENVKEDEELSQLNSSGERRNKGGAREEGEKTSQEEVFETSRRTSASSIISQEDLVSRKDSAKLEDFRQSSTEMSPLKTTYITSHGDSESLMTSSFYGNLPTEDEMIGKVEHFREFRHGRGYESVTEIGPNGERRERTYFYGRDEDPRGARDSKSRFVKAYYTEDGQQREEEQPRFVHKYYTSEIPEEESLEKTHFVQRFYTEKSSKPDSNGKFRFVETVSEEPIESMDFAKAVDEHVSARGEYLGKEELSKYGAGKSKPEEEAENGSGTESEKKDVIGDWGRPLGLPLPPKNMNRNYGFPGQNISTTSSLSTPTDTSDSVNNWGQPMSLPSPAPPPTQNGTAETLPGKGIGAIKETPKKEKKIQSKKNISDNNKSSGTNTPSRRSESPVKQLERRTPSTGRSNRSAAGHVYLDLTYVPHHGNSYYSNVEFFKKVRARYYVFSGTEPSKEVYNALLEAKQTWENKQLEVTIIPTYDTDVLGYWVAENEETLAKHKIDLSPSASRCTINLQDHETSCSAYRLEF